MENIKRGTVFHQGKNLFSVQLENGDYSVMELVGPGRVNFGDILTGSMDKTGHTALTDQTSLVQLEVVVQKVHCTRVEALLKTTLL
jgi:hypothetical protein